MRISDWSSDVCSSDLRPGWATTSATTRTWPSSGSTTRPGTSAPASMRSSRRWGAPWPPSSRDRAQLVRLTLVNQYYAPDISPTAQMAASLAEHRADRGDQVTVITGRAGYLEGISPAGALRAGPGLRIRRAWTPDLGKSSVPRRLLGYVAFLIGSSARLLVLRRQDVIVAMTTPPFVVVTARSDEHTSELQSLMRNSF